MTHCTPLLRLTFAVQLALRDISLKFLLLTPKCMQWPYILSRLFAGQSKTRSRLSFLRAIMQTLSNSMHFSPPLFQYCRFFSFLRTHDFHAYHNNTLKSFPHRCLLRIHGLSPYTHSETCISSSPLLLLWFCRVVDDNGINYRYMDSRRTFSNTIIWLPSVRKIYYTVVGASLTK